AGHFATVGMGAEDPLPRHEALELLGGEEALAREDGVVGDGAVALAEQEAVALVPVRVGRIDVEDVLVEDVEEVEGRGGAAVVLLVPGRAAHQVEQLVDRREGLYRHFTILAYCDRLRQVDPAIRFKALGHPVRLGIALRLAQEPDGTCACDFADIFGVSQPTVSQHLKVLREAQLVSTRRQGNQIYYTLDAVAAQELLGVLTQLAA